MPCGPRTALAKPQGISVGVVDLNHVISAVIASGRGAQVELSPTSLGFSGVSESHSPRGWWIQELDGRNSTESNPGLKIDSAGQITALRNVDRGVVRLEHVDPAALGDVPESARSSTSSAPGDLAAWAW